MNGLLGGFIQSEKERGLYDDAYQRGGLVPMAINPYTGRAEWAMPGLLSGMADSFMAPGAVLAGQKAPTVEDAFGVAGAAMTGGIPFGAATKGAVGVFGGNLAKHAFDDSTSYMGLHRAIRASDKLPGELFRYIEKDGIVRPELMFSKDPNVFKSSPYWLDWPGGPVPEASWHIVDDKLVANLKGYSDKDMYEKSIDQIFSPKYDHYFRFTNNKNEPVLIRRGEMRNSRNYAENFNEPGLSVAEGPHYSIHPYKYGYELRGRKIGDGSDGEPLVDPKAIDWVGKIIPAQRLVQKDRMLQRQILKDNGFPDLMRFAWPYAWRELK